MIRCPNIDCQLSNPEGNETCTSCRTFLPHRYLWVAGQDKLDPQQLSERYVWQHQRVVLDTKPGVPPLSPEPVPPYIWPYLMLAPHGLHVPQPYAFLSNGSENGLLLLDTPAIAASPKGESPSLLPSLTEAWPTASPLRQLNWLWQIAKLWADFAEQDVVSSLLLNTCLRVHGSLVRLLELSPDTQAVTLGNLGSFWKKNLLLEAHPTIRDFLEALCSRLIDGDIDHPDILVGYLDQAIAASADGYQVDYRLAVMTDQGPSRKRNEDACYPASGTNQIHTLGPKAKAKHRHPLLLLVCDGIGGHDGGDVASRLAIATIQQELAPLLEWLADQPLHDPGTVTLAIEQAIGAANDTISQHNDQGHRQARDRMGTTIVMALIIGVHIYIGHVGDSRAYRVSANSCRQITFDDDVAAREVRLGYGFYADVANRPGTGALIQALGMANSVGLHVVVQRLILDEDIVLLLCSDGLSDYDRVEQAWRTHLLPILTHKADPAKTVTGLIQLANTYNGHDNVTVGVVAARLQFLKPASVPKPSSELPTITPSARPPIQPRSSVTTQPLPSEPPPTSRPATARKGSPWPVLLGLTGLLGAVTALTMVFFRESPRTAPPPSAVSLPESIQDTIDQDPVGIDDGELSTPSLTPGSYLQLTRPVALSIAPEIGRDSGNDLGQLPNGAIAQVLTRQEPAGDQSRWVKIKVCALPETVSSGNIAPDRASSQPPAASGTIADSAAVTSSDATSLTSGTEGWIPEAQLVLAVRAAEALSCPAE